MEELLSVKSVAEELNLRYGQVIRLIKKKKIDAMKVEGGWGWLISRTSLDAFKCSQKQ